MGRALTPSATSSRARTRRRRRGRSAASGRVRTALLGLTAVVAAVAAVPVASPRPAHAEGPPERPDTRTVMFVGNNWDGTADVIDARSFERLARINTIPDKEERMAEIRSDPDKLAFFLAIRQFVGEGNDQYTDDMFTSHDGRFVYVSRPSFADVVGISLETGEVVWRFPMEGYRSDHMAISPDGTKLLVSDSTANKVHELDTATGTKTGEFASGDSPHENAYTEDGSRIFHASIGRVYTPTDRDLDGELELVRDTSKGDRWFQIHDGSTLDRLARYDMGDKLAEFGRDDLSAAVRPMAVAPGEETVYFQVSFFHGFAEFDLTTERVTRVIELPIADDVPPREQYLLDSAHHGLAIDPTGQKLCVAGTMSDYGAIVELADLDGLGPEVTRDEHTPTILEVGRKPYWSTNGPDGRHCWVSASGDDQVAVIDYEREEIVEVIPVGDHPQRVRVGVVHEDLLADDTSAVGDSVRRIQGDDRYGTAAAAARSAFPDGADTVFVATGEDFVDALAVGPVAGRAPGPVLLTARDHLPEATRAALADMDPSSVYVIGGRDAVSDATMAQIGVAAGAPPERVAGSTRSGTAAAIAERFADPGAVDVVYVANGYRSTDALAGGPAAGVEGAVLLLVEHDRIPPATHDALRRLAPGRVEIVGGKAVVGDGVAQALERDHGATVVRHGGVNRFDTAAIVSAATYEPGTPAYVASGERRAFADSTAGNPPAIVDRAPILLVHDHGVPAETAAELRRLAPPQIIVLGGPAAVPPEVERDLEAFTP